MTTSILLHTKPVSINKRYGIFRGRNILSKDYREAKEALSWEIKSQWKKEMIEEEVAVKVTINYSKRKPDIDAYLKILFDSMEGIVLKNDSLITEAHIIRRKTKTPFVVIEIMA